MKRNNMVLKLVQSFAEMDVQYPNGYDYYELSNFILDKIEEFGMVYCKGIGEKDDYGYIDYQFGWDDHENSKS
jgi:hypothetical protein